MYFKRAFVMNHSEWPVSWISIAIIVFFTCLCWGLAAASYSHAELGWRTGGFDSDIAVGRRGGAALGDFVKNAVSQVPNARAVLEHTMHRSWWVIILFVLLQGLAIIFWWKASSFARTLREEDQRRRTRFPSQY
jgi:hypothetical protein